MESIMSERFYSTTLLTLFSHRGGTSIPVISASILTLIGFALFKRKAKGTQASENLPWQGRISIYSHIESHIDSEGRVTEEGDKLPDAGIGDKPGDMWVSGGLDGSYGHHVGGGSDTRLAAKVFGLATEISKKDKLAKKVQLYNLLAEDHTVMFLDPALERIVNSRISPKPKLHEYARWLAKRAPDRGAVKFGIALLGIIRDRSDLETVRLLGKHDEFTLYSAVAISNMLDDPTQELWQLAQQVDGWGKIHLVERVAETEDPIIQEWLLREGYKNRVSNEYLAYVCAKNGNLRSAMSREDIDDELLESAGEIIQALIEGGPAEDMNDYEDGIFVVESYLNQMQTRADKLRDLIAVDKIRSFLKYIEEGRKGLVDLEHKEDIPEGMVKLISDGRLKSFVDDFDKDKENLEVMGWTESKRAFLMEVAVSVISQPKWEERVRDYLSRKDDIDVYILSQSSEIVGMDIWEEQCEMLREDPLNSGLWYHVAKGANEARMQKVIDLAQELLPLVKIARGPSMDILQGEDFMISSSLEWILQELGKHPTQGYQLVEVGIRCSGIRTRNAALQVLSKWGRDNWEPEVEGLLRKALSEEPDRDVRVHIKNVLRGRSSE